MRPLHACCASSPEVRAEALTLCPPSVCLLLCCSCKIKVKGWQTVCAHRWEPKWDLPFGNSITGRAWDKDRPDPGTYEGGTYPEDAVNGTGAVSGGSGAQSRRLLARGVRGARRAGRAVAEGVRARLDWLPDEGGAHERRH
jgi:hypothetical protein